MRLLSLLLSLLFLSSAVAADAKPKRLLFVSQGPDGHPPGTHEYVAGQKLIAQSLANVPGLEVTTSFADAAWAEGPELLGKCDGVVLFLSEGGKWMNADPRRKEALARLADRGGGITGLHWAIGTKEAENIDIEKDSFPAADVITMGNVLHGYDEPLKQRFIQKAYDAVNDGGAFIAIESVIDDERRQNTLGLLMSLNMLIENGDGFDYSHQDFQRWAKAAGFRSTEVIPLAGPTSAAIAYK